MSLDSIVNITITVANASPTQAGFGVPLIVDYHTNFPERFRQYAELSELIDDGFSTNDWLYKKAAALLSQDNRPSVFLVGRRSEGPSLSWGFTPVNTTEGFVYTLNFTSPAGVAHNISVTVGAGDAVADICDDLTTAITAVSGLTATDNTTSVQIDADVDGANWSLNFGSMVPLDDYEFIDDTIATTTSITADLATIAAELEAAETGFYFLLTTHNSEVESKECAAWALSNGKIFVGESSDTGCIETGVTDDVMSDIAATNNDRAHMFFSRFNKPGNFDSAIVGKCAPKNPGSITWAFKTLAGVTVDKLRSGWKTQIENKGGNHYTEVAGIGITYPGQVADGDFVDVTRGIDWVEARIQEAVYAALVNNDKVPFTDSGAQALGAVIEGVLRRAVLRSILAESPAPTVTVPSVASVSTNDKANRLLPDIKFDGTLAGAVHKVKISGKVVV